MTLVPSDEFEATIVARRAPRATSAPEVIGHYLVAVAGSEPGKRLEIASEPVTLGRSPQQTLVFADDTEMSRAHARVWLANGEVRVEDLGSTNGTFVDAERLTAPIALTDGNVIRVGRQFLKYERRSKSDVERSIELDRDLRKATEYVLSLLPAPLDDGPVRTEWSFIPSTQLGGDAFGYHWLDPRTFVFYLLDVSGHGAGSAMHSVTVMNLLRQRALPGVDFENPAAVLASLNARFQMDAHNGLYFTIWYGVYRTDDRSLAYGSAGHHPAVVVGPARETTHALGEPALMIGALPEYAYETQRTTVPAGSVLYLFSDGVFEIVTTGEERWTMTDFLPLLLQQPLSGTSESDRIYRAVRKAAREGPFDDDFSLMVVTFP